MQLIDCQIVGLYEPTAGTALINGLDIRDDMESIRESLGICPQHDVLYDNLTVYEHLKLFCQLKGMEDNKKIQAEITSLLDDLKFASKRNAKASALSGGMKRKLSVAMAFCGGSKVMSRMIFGYEILIIINGSNSHRE